MSTTTSNKNGAEKPATSKPVASNEGIRSGLLESAALLKNYNLMQYFVRDAYIDAMDINNSWRVARISEIQGDSLLVTFDGWSKRWDENFKFGSNKLAAFRRFSPPYTGGTKNTSREFEFSDAVQKFPKHKKEMERIAEEKFLIGNPHQLTQYMRGELYIVVDAILSTASKPNGADELRACVEFLENFISYFIKYLDFLQIYLREFIEARSINTLLYLVHEKVAAVSCFPEMFESMCKIFGGGGPRSSKFYQANDFQLQPIANPIVTKPKDKYSSSHNQIVNFINYFGANGGFDRFITLLKWECEAEKKEAEGESVYKFPLNIIESMTVVVEPVVPLMTSQFKEKFFSDFKAAFFQRVENISLREIKDVDPSLIFKLIRIIQPLLDEAIGKDAHSITETAELTFALKMIKSQYLEKRIKGIQEFKEFIDRVDQDSDYSKRPMRYFNSQKLAQFIHQHKILDIILGENFHVEVFKRASPVFRFLVKNNSLLNDHLNLFWKAYETKHEDSIRAVFEVIIELSKILPLESLEFLFVKMINIPQEKFDDAAINLIKEFTINAMNTVGVPTQTSSGIFSSKKTKAQPTTKYEYFGLKLLWDLIQDSSKLDPQHTTFLLGAISVLFKNSNFKLEREKYLTFCFDNLKKGVSVAQSIMISLHIFNTYTQNAMWSREASLEDIILKYNKDYNNLIELVVLDFEKYMNEVQKSLERLKSKNVKIENPGNYIFVGKYNHSSQIDHRLIFIEQLSNHVSKKYELSLDHLKTIWNVLIKRAQFDVERIVFFNWLTKQRESSNQKRVFIIPDNLLKAMFNSIFLEKVMMENYSNISPEVFGGIQDLFFGINLKEDHLEPAGKGNGSYKVNHPESLIGTEFFWNTVINCQNESILKIVRSILCTLYLKFSNSVSPEVRINFWTNFTVKCVDLINSSNIESRTFNIIALLREFFINFDGRKYLNSDTPSTTMLTLTFQLKTDERKKDITMPINSTIYYLRMKAMEEFNIRNNEIELLIGANNSKINQEIEEEFNIQALETQILKEPKRDKDIVIGVTKTTSQWNTRDKFKSNISNHQKVMDALFELLSGSNMRMVEYVWEILTFLPVNKQVRSQIEKLNVETEEQWSKILDSSCFRKLLYCLQIIEDITRSTGEPIDRWTLQFSKLRGFSYLYKIYMSVQITEVKSTFYIRCFSSIARLLAYFIKKYYFVTELEPKTHLVELTNKTLTLLNCGLVKTSSTSEDVSFQKSNSDDVYMAEFIAATFELIQACIEMNLSLLKTIIDFPELSSILKIGLLTCESFELRRRMETSLNELIDFHRNTLLNHQKKEGLPQPGVDQCQSSPHIFFLCHLVRDYLFKVNLKDMRNKCKQFFSLICSLLQRTTPEEIQFLESKDVIKLSNLLNLLVLEMKNLTPFERSVTDNDYLLQGFLKLIETLLHFDPKHKDTLAGNSDFMKELIHSCLFEIPTGLEDSSIILPPKCKSPDSRKAAFNLLGLLLEGSIQSPGIFELVDYMNKILSYAYWRSSSHSDWHITPNYMEKSHTGLVGLKNLGCTCYMNSLMQQFYMIPDFRNSILEVEEGKVKVDKQDNLLYQFQMILSGLKNSHKPYIDPKGFCAAYKDFDNKPINVLEQMDVDEFFNNFLDKLENELKSSKNEHIIKKFFGGVMSNELICKGCPHYSEREELFLAVSLQVKNKKNINESLASFIEGEMLEGDNAYQCDKCDKKVPTLKRTCIKKLPNILILVLKRFEFDFDTMSKSKVNDFCEFPRKIDMKKYTQGYLKSKDRKKQEDMESECTNDEETGDLEFPEDYYEYNLKGVIIHMGTADSGHYYSLISDKFYFEDETNSDNWFRFDDTMTRQFDASELGSEAFGGEEKFSNLSNMGNMTLSKSMRERTRNAYMLLYQRSQFFNEEGKKITSLFESNKGKISGSQSLSPVEQEIKEDNLKFYINKHLFDLEFFNFVLRILQASENFTTMEKNVLELVKIGFLYFLSVVLRAKDRDKLPRFLKTLKKIASQNYEISNWFIQQISNEEVLSELLIECPIKDMRYLITGLIKAAMEKMISDQDGTWDQKTFTSKSNLVKLINSLIFLLGENVNREQRKLMDQFYRIFHILSTLSRTVRNYMVSQRVIGRLIFYIQEVALPSSYKNTSEFKQSRSETRSGIELGNFFKDTNSGKNQIKTIEDIVERKKERTYMDNLSINYSHLLVCLSNLICCIHFSVWESTTPFVTYDLVDARLDKDELDVLQNQAVWKKLMSETYSKLSKTSLAKMFGHLSYLNKEFSMELIKTLFDELSKAEEERLKTLLIIIEAVLPINDKFQNERLKDGLEYYFSVLKDGMLYYKFTDILLSYLFKMCSKNSILFNAVNKFLNSSTKNYAKTIETWIRELVNMGKMLSQGSLKLYKKKNTQMNYPALNQDRLVKKISGKLALLKSLVKGESDKLLIEYDSDEDFSNYKFKLDDRFDYNSESGVVIAVTVCDTIDDMIQFRGIKESFHKWVHYDSERIGSFTKLQNYYDDNI